MLDHLPNDPIHHFNQQFSSKNGSYESWVPPNFAPKPRKPAERYDLYDSNRNNNHGIQLRRVDSGQSESGVHSPPLWNNIPPGSPGSRLQAIVKGQKELMDMAKKMPESYYELTLKDLVEEQTKLENSQEQCLLKGKEEEYEENEDVYQLAHEKMDSRKLTANKKIDGNLKDCNSSSRRINVGGIENKGLFLKMVFPFGMNKSKSKKKKKLMKSSGSAKITPKTEGCDNDWLKKIFSSGSDRSRSSSSHSTRNGSTGSSSTRTKKGFFTSCLPCFHSSTKGKTAELKISNPHLVC